MLGRGWAVSVIYNEVARSTSSTAPRRLVRRKARRFVSATCDEAAVFRTLVLQVKGRVSMQDSAVISHTAKAAITTAVEANTGPAVLRARRSSPTTLVALRPHWPSAREPTSKALLLGQRRICFGVEGAARCCSTVLTCPPSRCPVLTSVGSGKASRSA